MFPDSEDQFDMMRAAISMGIAAMEAQAIIAMRMWGMMGLWNTHPSENLRMFTEKASAALAAQQGVARAILSGEGPGAAALAAVTPVRRRTRSNVKRLTRRGPKLGI
ncbi:MAG: antifreeze protein [Paracoccaceae bacterium]